MSEICLFDSCAFCGEIVRELGRYPLEPGDAELLADVLDSAVTRELVHIGCPHGCCETFVTAEELIPA